jgi:hypothetical protein
MAAKTLRGLPLCGAPPPHPALKESAARDALASAPSSALRAPSPPQPSPGAGSASIVGEKGSGRLLSQIVASLLLCLMASSASAADLPASPSNVALRLVVSSYRSRVQHPELYVYEHDGVGSGTLKPAFPSVNKRSDHHPAFSVDGRYLVYASEPEGAPSTIGVWDFQESKLLELPGLNDSPHAQGNPVFGGLGGRIVFDAWLRPGQPGRWDLVGYDIAAKKVEPVVLPGSPGSAPVLVSTSKGDERSPSITADGRLLAFAHWSGGTTGTDVRVIDLVAGREVETPGLNSDRFDGEPSFSDDGRWLAIATDDDVGEGGRDVLLYDMEGRRPVRPEGVNTAGQEQSPALSADGRYLVWVAERLEGEGERDVYLFDIAAEKRLETPGLNSPRDEMDPAIWRVTGR